MSFLKMVHMLISCGPANKNTIFSALDECVSPSKIDTPLQQIAFRWIVQMLI